MLNIGTQELLVVLLIALIVVGPRRLPELSRSIGKGLREFRKVQDEVKDMVKLDLDDSAKPARPATPTAPGAHRTPRPIASQRPGPLDGAADDGHTPAPGDEASDTPGPTDATQPADVAPASGPEPEGPAVSAESDQAE